MATVENRSRYCVTVKNRDDLTRKFPFTQLAKAEAYRDSLREENLKPRITQEEDQFFVRIRQKGYPTQQMTFDSRDKAEEFCKQIDAERSRGLFRDYTKSHNITFADLMVRFLLKEAPKHKSFQMQAYKIEGWLEDSEARGQVLLEGYRAALREADKPVRSPKFQMRETCSSLLWIHKRLTEVEATDIEDFIAERLLSVAPATVDRELDIVRSIFTVATKVWGYNLDTNPMDAVRRPRYFNERERRISPDEEARLIEALAQLDHERAVEQRLQALADEAMEGMAFTSNSARKKVLASERKRLLQLAQETCEPVPYFETFAHFQLMTGARRSETLTLTWDRVDFAAGTAFLPETKNGRPRKLSLRSELLDLLGELPRTGDLIFPIGLAGLSYAWTKACAAAGLHDLHIHDCRHEAISRVGKLICVGLNYTDHAEEAGMAIPTEPVIFMKATSCIGGPNDNIEIPPDARKVDWEVELGIVIGKAGRYLSKGEALDHVAGYCVVNDVSERAYQLERNGQWDKGKSCDTFGPIGPWMVTRDEVPDPHALDIWLEVDGQRYQNGSTANMIFDVATIVSYISQFMSLQAGDVIATGTPAGVGLGQKPAPVFLRAGQTMHLGISGLGVQRQLAVSSKATSHL